VSKISELVSFAKSDTTNTHHELNLGKVPNFQAQAITALTGVSINGATKVISAYGIIHAIKRHGNHNEEQERGQIGITDNDFELIISILNSPDEVVRGKDGSRGKKALIFSKKIKACFYYVVMSVFSSKKGTILNFETMYIKK
jgi:valyl-tRNA synthetase